MSHIEFPRPENHYNVQMKELGAQTNENNHQTPCLGIKELTLSLLV